MSIIQDNVEDFDDLSTKDGDVIFSVAGYVTRYVDCQCFSASQLSQPFVVDFDRSHFDRRPMSRGGWIEPTPNILFLCTIATVAFKHLTSGVNRKIFLSL